MSSTDFPDGGRPPGRFLAYIEEKSLVTMVLMSLNFLHSDSPMHLHDIIRCFDQKFVHQFDPEKSYLCGDVHPY